jgi:hypothetical protein
LQLDGLFETLIGGPVTTAGNHRCMLPDGGVPSGHGSIPFDHGAPCTGPLVAPALERHGQVEGSTPSGLADACLHRGEPDGLACALRKPGRSGGSRMSTWTAILRRSRCCARTGPGET